MYLDMDLIILLVAHSWRLHDRCRAQRQVLHVMPMLQEVLAGLTDAPPPPPKINPLRFARDDGELGGLLAAASFKVASASSVTYPFRMGSDEDEAYNVCKRRRRRRSSTAAVTVSCMGHCFPWCPSLFPFFRWQDRVCGARLTPLLVEP